MKELDAYLELLIQEHELGKEYEKSYNEIRDDMYKIESGMFDWVKETAQKHNTTGPTVIKIDKGWLVANTDKHFDRVIIVPIDNFIDLTTDKSS